MFTVEDDDNEVLEDLLTSMDTNHDGKLSWEEVFAALRRFDSDADSGIVNALQALGHESSVGIEAEVGMISLHQLRSSFNKIPRVRGQRVQWANSLGLGNEIARFLRKGNIMDGLEGLKMMAEEELKVHIMDVCSKFSAILPDILSNALGNLRKQKISTAEEFKNTKFCMENAFEAQFATLEDFENGPEALIGSPNPNVEEGMRTEHCFRSNSKLKFVSSNYNFTTWPQLEWDFVVNPAADFPYPHTPKDKSLWKVPEGAAWKGDHGREIVKLEVYLADEQFLNSGMKRGELIASRLYTGPMFNLYNCVLRKFPAALLANLLGNRYETTLFCIISAVVRLSKTTEIPPDRLLYRGLGGAILPPQFWRRGNHFQGGVEFGLMSTTSNRKVAELYSGADRGRGTILEFVAGRVDIGASVVWLSQYPAEVEVLFPPLTCLEVLGDPKMEGDVVVFTLRANVCLKGLTLDQLVERRKRLHVILLSNLREDIRHSLHAEIQVWDSEYARWAEEQAPRHLKVSISASPPTPADLVSLIEEELEELARQQAATDACVYNEDDTLYLSYTTAAIRAKSQALAKLRLFMEHRQRAGLSLTPPPPSSGAGQQQASPDAWDIELLWRVAMCELARFDDAGLELELRSGVVGFPWAQVMRMAPTVDLGKWRPRDVDRVALQRVQQEICQRDDFIRAVALIRTRSAPDRPAAEQEVERVVLSLGGQGLRSLTSLSLDGQPVGGVGTAEVLAFFLSMAPGLTSLSMKQTGATAVDWETVLLACPSLRWLNDVDAAATIDERAAMAPPSLWSAMLSGPAAVPASAGVGEAGKVASLLTGGLKRLNLFKGQAAVLAEKLAEIKSLRDARETLVHLKLMGLGSDRVAAVAALLPRSAATLLSINLSCNQLGSAGAASLAMMVSERFVALLRLDL